jgi:hypothetical protein
LAERRFWIPACFAQGQILANRDAFELGWLLPRENQAQLGPFMPLEGKNGGAID